MRARGFALRDAFPDVLKGLITAEEAQDYPDEAKPRQAKDITPRNPLDVVAAPKVSELISDPVAIAQAMADTVDVPEPVAMTVEQVAAEVVQEDVAVVDIPTVVVERVPGEDDEPLEAVVAVGYPLQVPGRAEPVSVHQSLDEWQDAYEDMAEKIAKAGKRPERERMTILREFKEANEATIERVDMVKRIRHTANYTKRIKALGAGQ
jgi:hypothetical protein